MPVLTVHHLGDDTHKHTSQRVAMAASGTHAQLLGLVGRTETPGVDQGKFSSECNPVTNTEMVNQPRERLVTSFVLSILW